MNGVHKRRWIRREQIALALPILCLTACGKPATVPPLDGATVLQHWNLSKPAYFANLRGRAKYTVLYTEDELRTWSPVTGRDISTIPIKSGFRNVAVNNTGDQVWFVTGSGLISCYRASDEGQLNPVLVDYQLNVGGRILSVNDIHALPNNKVLINCFSSSYLFVGELKGNTLKLSKRLQRCVVLLGSDDEEQDQYIYTLYSSAHSSVSKLQLDTGISERSVYRDAQVINGMVVNPNRFLLVNHTGEVNIVDSYQDESVYKFKTKGAVNWVAYVTCSKDRIVVYDRKSAILLSSDGKLLGQVKCQEPSKLLSVIPLDDRDLLVTMESSDVRLYRVSLDQQ